MRIDLWLVEQGLAPSRQRAQEWISAGRVRWIPIASTAAHGLGAADEGRVFEKASASVDIEAIARGEGRIEVQPADGGAEFVSRGGLKLDGALHRVGLDVSGLRVLDVGISTGGFTDCCLQRGAVRIVGLDVGHGQLAEKLRRDRRVSLFEGVNARVFAEAETAVPVSPQQVLAAGEVDVGFDLIVIDVSFISLTLILPIVPIFLRPGGRVLALVKPQFEVGREGLGKNGIVKDAVLFAPLETSMKAKAESLGLKVEAYFESAILGADGNREFFIYAAKI